MTLQTKPNWTKLRYLEDMQLFEAEAVVQSVFEEQGRTGVVLDQTIFYPKGGGQPCDRGEIRTAKATFRVDVTRMESTAVHHFGTLVGVMVPGETVTMQIDVARRVLNSRLHTGGEVICAAVRRLGYPDWYVVGAMHYPDRAEIQYDVSLGERARGTLAAQIEAEANAITATGGVIKAWWEKDRRVVKEYCGFDPDYVHQGEPVRIVVTTDKLGRPCVGTHVSDVSGVGRIKIVKIKTEGGRTSIRYTVLP